MSEPDPDPLDADLSALFAAERARPAPLPEARARVLARVVASVGPQGGGGAPPVVPPAGGALLKPVLFGLALGGVLVGAVAFYNRAAPAPPPPLVETALAPEPGVAPVPVVETAAPTVPAAPPRPSVEASAPARHEDTLAAERSILDEANRALGAGRSAAAFEALARHAEAFPRGRLSEEREGLWLRTLLAAGRRDEARSRAARFKRLYPRSMLLPALESALGPIP